MPDGAPERRCASCSSPLDAHQRYCLACGERAIARGGALEGLMRGAADGWRERGAPAGAAGAGLAAAEPSAAAGAPPPRTPSRKLAAGAVASFLGFGVLIGLAAGSRVDNTLAAGAGAPLRLVMGPSHSGGGGGSGSAGSSEAPSEGSSEAPAAESEPTPASTTSTTAATTTSTTTSSSSESGAGSEGEKAASSPESSSAPATKLPPIKHVFVIALSDEPYASVFGPSSAAHFLTGTLEPRGELLVRYDAVTHEQLANGVALISGQGPTAETAANCPTYTNFSPTGTSGSEQLLGSGCVYPASTQTLPGQLAAKHLTWRAYVQGTDEAGAQAPACAHPPLGQGDPSATAAGGTYATFRNPFVYFQGIAGAASCASDVVGTAALKADLATPKRTPSFSYIVPDRCHDGSATPCSPGAPAGLEAADGFLSHVVPMITGSKAYAQGGLLVITVDQAPSSGPLSDSSSCCGQPQFPNVPAVTTPAGRPAGGGTVGALLLSPYVKGGTTSQEAFNHFSLLRTIEDLFSLKHLGYAALPSVKPFAPAMFTAKPAG